jgi:hypothetical protein
VLQLSSSSTSSFFQESSGLSNQASVTFKLEMYLLCDTWAHNLRGLSRKELEALSSEVDNRCNDNRTAILIEGCLKK